MESWDLAEWCCEHELQAVVFHKLAYSSPFAFLNTKWLPVSGSVSGANCKELAAQPDVDGFLVGGASLKVII